MKERLTEHCKKAMNAARLEAAGQNREVLGSEHILLGILREPEGLAAKVLGGLGVTLDSARQKIEALPSGEPATGATGEGQLPMSTHAKSLLGLAMEEASSLRHTKIGTEHLLLALPWEKECQAAQVLADLGIDLNEIRSEVTTELAAREAEDTSDVSEALPKDRTKTGRHTTMLGRLPFGNEAKNTLRLAHEEALTRGHGHIRPEHILLGLLGDPTGPLTDALKEIGADPEKLTASVQRIIGDEV